MDTVIMQYIFAIAVFLLVNLTTWYALDIRLWVPRAFDYKPFCCRKCLTFWANVAIAIGAALGGAYTFAITLGILGALNAVAMTIDERM